MADKSTCSNCGLPLKRSWLVCRSCHQARWKLILPYYLWGAVFLAGSAWAITKKLPKTLDTTDPISLILPILSVIILIIGVVMLMIAFMATLRGLAVRKVPASQRSGGPGTGYYTTVPAAMANPEVSPQPIMAPAEDSAPLAPKLEIAQKQILFCQKCNHENAPEAAKCAQCGKKLLPGVTAGVRFLGFIGTTILSVVIIGGVFLYYRYMAEGGFRDVVYLPILVGLGVGIFFLGLILALRKTPLYERYETRAKQHVSLNPLQAIADYSAAINSAPPAKALEFLLERGKLYQGLGMASEARADWQRALENVNSQLAMPKASIDLYKQRAELLKELGMQDEYALQMLRYTIEKENTLKTKRKDIAMGWEEGIKKGLEDNERQELDKIRTEIMANPRYKIVAQCKQCRKQVDLNARLECPNDANHKKISDIRPSLRET